MPLSSIAHGTFQQRAPGRGAGSICGWVMAFFQGQASKAFFLPPAAQTCQRKSLNSGLRSRGLLSTYLSVTKFLDFCPKSAWDCYLMLKTWPWISGKFICEECSVIPYIDIFHCGCTSWAQHFPQSNFISEVSNYWNCPPFLHPFS